MRQHVDELSLRLRSAGQGGGTAAVAAPPLHTALTPTAVAAAAERRAAASSAIPAEPGQDPAPAASEIAVAGSPRLSPTAAASAASDAPQQTAEVCIDARMPCGLCGGVSGPLRRSNAAAGGTSADKHGAIGEFAPAGSQLDEVSASIDRSSRAVAAHVTDRALPAGVRREVARALRHERELRDEEEDLRGFGAELGRQLRGIGEDFRRSRPSSGWSRISNVYERMKAWLEDFLRRWEHRRLSILNERRRHLLGAIAALGHLYKGPVPTPSSVASPRAPPIAYMLMGSPTAASAVPADTALPPDEPVSPIPNWSAPPCATVPDLPSAEQIWPRAEAPRGKDTDAGRGRSPRISRVGAEADALPPVSRCRFPTQRCRSGKRRGGKGVDLAVSAAPCELPQLQRLADGSTFDPASLPPPSLPPLRR